MVNWNNVYKDAGVTWVTVTERDDKTLLTDTAALPYHYTTTVFSPGFNAGQARKWVEL